MNIVGDGALRETHLCEKCAEELQSGNPKSATLSEWLAGLGMMTADAPKFPAPARPKRADMCPSCGLRFLDLKKSGLVGCQSCYEVFESRLSPLLKRAHDGGDRHTGKSPSLRTTREIVRIDGVDDEGAVPEDARTPGTVAERVEALTHELALAIEAEHYERAASLRDELAELTGDGQGGLGSVGGPDTETANGGDA
jgi:protein arginine kinase activator